MLKDVVTMCTMHVVKIKILLVKELVMYECAMESAKIMLNMKQLSYIFQCISLKVFFT